jgi:hypothetical protein
MPNPEFDEEEGRDWRQDKLLTPNEIDQLKQAGVDIHKIKGKRSASKKDLYKDGDGNVYVKPKGGQDPGEFTGFNLRTL